MAGRGVIGSGLLSHRINQLLLNANASFPSQSKDAKEMINDWRRTQRCRLVVPSDSRSSGVSADSVCDDPDDGSTRGE